MGEHGLGREIWVEEGPESELSKPLLVGEGILTLKERILQC
jgi:hypothetical protein